MREGIYLLNNEYLSTLVPHAVHWAARGVRVSCLEAVASLDVVGLERFLVVGGETLNKLVELGNHLAINGNHL